MRTTLAIDDDIMFAARNIAARNKKTIGEIVSELARKGLTPDRPTPKYRNGIRLMPVTPGATIVTLELVNQLRDEFE